MRLAAKLMLAWVAVILAVGGCVGTSLITGVGLWYGPYGPHRQQTEALLQGHVALSTSPTALEHNFAWGTPAGGVQQVWGLGIPAWRLPFEAAARLLGWQGFPDRLALAAAWALMIYVVLVAFLAPAEPGIGPAAQLGRHPERLAVIGALIFFPPFLTLAQGRFDVYEEAVFYGYMYGVGLFAGLIAFLRRPRLAGLLTLCLLSGLAGFFRPTHGCYGLASALLACWLTRRLKWPWWQTGLGLLTFVAAGGLLFCSNWQRFGSGFEFGHNVNMTSRDLTFTARFGAPFSREPFWPAFRELMGSLFWVQQTTGQAYAAFDVVAWQSDTPRWRQFYKTTFDFSILAGLLWCWARAGWRWAAATLRHRSDTWDSEVYLAAAWSAISLIPLCAFYLRFHVLMSRYVLDLGPGFAVGVAGCFMLKWRRSIPSYVTRVVLLGVFVGWWHWDVATAQVGRMGAAAGPVDYSRGVNSRRRNAIPELGPLPNTYQAGDQPRIATGIYGNGMGWEMPMTGTVSNAVSLFFDSPRNIEVEVEPAPGWTVTDGDYAQIQAKVSREFLKLASMSNTDRGKVLVFDGPKHDAYRHGIQLISLGLISPEDYMRRPCPFRLLRVNCNEYP